MVFWSSSTSGPSSFIPPFFPLHQATKPFTLHLQLPIRKAFLNSDSGKSGCCTHPTTFSTCPWPTAADGDPTRLPAYLFWLHQLQPHRRRFSIFSASSFQILPPPSSTPANRNSNLEWPCSSPCASLLLTTRRHSMPCRGRARPTSPPLRATTRSRGL